MVGQSSCFSLHDAEKIRNEIEDLRNLFGGDEHLVGILNLLDKVVVFEPNENVNKYMKEAKKMILQSATTTTMGNWDDGLVKIICHMFVVCQGKQQLKDMLSSLLDSWKSVSHLVVEHLRMIIMERMNEEEDDFNSNCNLIQAVQRCCLYQVGRVTLSTITAKVFSYLSRLLLKYLEMIANSPNSTAVVKYQHFLCDVLNCASSVRTKVITDDDDVDDVDDITRQLCHLSMKVVRCESTGGLDDGLNLCNSAAMMYATLKINPKTSVHQQVRQLIEEFDANLGATKFTLIHGMLVVVTGIMSNNNKTNDCDEIISLNKDCSEIISLVFAQLHSSINKTAQLSFGEQSQIARCLQQWSRILVMDKKMRQQAGDKITAAVDDVDKQQGEFCMTQSAATSLLDYIVDHQNSTGGLLYHMSRDLLNNLLHADVTTTDPGQRSFLIQAVGRCSHLMTSSAASSAPYLIMSCVLDVVTSLSDVIKDVCIQLQPHILQAINDANMTTQASQLYRKCARNSKEAESLSVSMETWLKPILTSACTNITYMIRLLFQIYGSAGVDYVTNLLLPDDDDNDDVAMKDFDEDSRLRMLIVCLRSAQHLALYTHQHDDDVTTESRDQVDGNKLQSAITSALVHQNDDIRIEALAFLCESHKPSTLVTSHQLSLLRHNVKYLIKTQSTAFRQLLVAILGKFFVRLEGNHRTRLKKKLAPSDLYPQFMVWMLDFLLSNLTPDASHARKMTSLAIMEVLVATQHPDFRRVCVNHITTEVVGNLKHLINDEYDDIRDVTFQVFTSSIFTGGNILWGDEMEFCDVKSVMEKFRNPINPEQCHLSLDYLRFRMNLHQKQQENKQQQNNKTEDNFTYRLIEEIVVQMAEDIERAQTCLLSAASKCPIYGLLSAARLALQFTISRGDGMTSSSWRGLLGNLLTTCLMVNSLVAPVVDNESPEGYVPDDVITTSHEGGADVSSSQRLLVMCWRCSKEVANLFEIMATVTSSTEMKMNEQFKLIGAHLKKQLLSARHRATFEINFNSFKSYVGLLWRNGDVIKCEEWLMEILNKFDNEEEIVGICSTRRSAGLPFYLQAIIGGTRRSRQMDRLTEIAFNKLTSMLATTTNNNFDQLRKIHALNCLRALARDSSLSTQVTPHIDNCMVEAINGFSSSNWKIRNSSTLLMAALFYRVFGCNVERDLESSSKNRISSGELVKKFPKICDFFLETLKKREEGKKKKNAADEGKLHPILLILSRVFPSSNQQQIFNQLLPLIVRLSDSRWYLTRVMCSKVLQSLTTSGRCSDDENSAASWLLRIITGLSGVRTSSNQIHGSLLQMRKLVTKVQEQDVDDVWIDDVTTHIQRLSWLGRSSVNSCGTTRSEFINFFTEIHDLLDKWENSHEIVKKIAMELMEDPHSQQFGQIISFNHKRSYMTSQSVATIISSLPPRDVTIALFHDNKRAADIVTSYCADDLMMRMGKNADKMDSQLVGSIFDVWFHCLQFGGKWSEIRSALEFSFAIAREARVDDALMTSLLRFQARCFVIMTSQPLTKANGVELQGNLLAWIRLLSTALHRLRYAADIRHQVALALRTCCHVPGFVERTFTRATMTSSSDCFIEITRDDGDDVTIRGNDDVFTHVWRIALNLLADDDVRVRDVISDVCVLAVRKGIDQQQRHLVVANQEINILLTSDHVTDELALRASLHFLRIFSPPHRKSCDVTSVKLMTSSSSDQDAADEKKKLFESKSNGDSSYFEASRFVIPSL